MALNIPTTQEIKDRNLSNLESQLSQDAPTTERAFLRVLAATEALSHTELYKYAAERALQNLAITATGEDLDVIGQEFSVPRKVAEATVLTGTIQANAGVTIPATVSFIGDANGVRYFPDAPATAVSGSATVTVTASVLGVEGNLEVGDTLTIGAQIAGAETTLTVTSVDNTGADAETDEEYRPRVLFRIRASFGGGNAADYKAWAQGVAGVAIAYPYAGKPPELGLTSYPGDRTIYIQAEVAIDPDGIAPQSLLDEVREAVNTNPNTLKSRPPLGLIDDTLYIQSIERVSFYVDITGLTVPDPSLLGTVKSDIETALDSYFDGVSMYAEGVGVPIEDRNDLISTTAISDVVQGVLRKTGSYVEDIDFRLSIGDPLPYYRLDQGELGRLAGVTYV